MSVDARVRACVRSCRRVWVCVREREREGGRFAMCGLSERRCACVCVCVSLRACLRVCVCVCVVL